MRAIGSRALFGGCRKDSAPCISAAWSQFLDVESGAQGVEPLINDRQCIRVCKYVALLAGIYYLPQVYVGN